MDTATFALRAAMLLVPMVLSLSVHEFAHAWTARRLGDDTAAAHGRLTLNPLSHIDPVGTVALPLVLLWLSGSLGGAIPFVGWAKPVPINPARFTRRISIRRGIMLVAAAGPLSNLLFAFVAALVVSILHRLGAPALPEALEAFIRQMFYINIGLFLFNMIPVYPLDGQKVVSGILPVAQALWWERFNYRFGRMLLIGTVLLAPRIIAAPFALVSAGVLAAVGL